MKPAIFKTILLFILLSLAALFLILWLVYYSGFGIPEKIPVLDLRTYGILILVAFLLIVFFLQKSMLDDEPSTSLWTLLLAPFTVSLVSFFIYQLTRQLIILGNSFSDTSTVIILSSIFPALLITLLATSYAFRRKNINGIRSRIPAVITVVCVLLARQYVTHFDW